MLVLAAAAPPAWAQEPSPPPPAAPGRPAPDDKRRTLRSYGSNLAYNFAGFFTTGNHLPLVITATLTGPAFLLDEECQTYFLEHPHEEFGRIGATLGGTVAVAGLTVGFFSAGRIARGDRFRATTYDLSQAIIVTQVYTQALKFAVGRERPDHSENVSFPSGHSSNAFTAATVISRHYPRLAIPGYAVATFIAVSRMAANKHFFSDIVAGAGLGVSVGRLVVRRNGRPPDAPAPAPVTWNLLPARDRQGEGRGLTLVLTF
jgi:membrane-associated phospholipid phosphatase